MRSPAASCSRTRSCKAACEAARRSPRGRLHLVGLVSDGGVHSGWEHIEACIELAAQEGVPDLVVHAFTDGRDTLPTSAPAYIAELERWLRRAGRVGDGRRPLLRDGPRPALGAQQAGLRRDRARRRPAGRLGSRGGRRSARQAGDGRVHPTDRDRRLRRGCRRGCRHPPQLPSRPRPPARARARRARLRRVRPRLRAGARADHVDLLSGGVALSGRLPAQRARDDAGRCTGRRRAAASSTSPRPRSTPM